MITVSNDIKNAYNQYTTQRKSKILVGTHEFFIQNMDLFADAYDEGNIVGNTIARTLQFDIETEYVRGIDEFQLFDGIWTGEEYEYINLGTFKLFEEQGVDDFFSHITAYDQLIKFNEIYNSAMTTYPTTIYGLLESICEQAGVTLGTQSIANGDKTLNGNVFVEGETLKDVLKAICQISGTFAMMSNDTLILKLQGSDSLTLSKYQLADPEYKRTTWKWNQVILGMQDIIGEYVLRQDDEDVELNGVHRLVINNNPFVYTQELREEYIDDLFNAIKGFGYVSYEAEWEGLPYVELGDTLTIDGYDSVVLRYEIKSPDGLNSMIQAPSIIDSVIDYVNNTDDINNKQRRTEYRVDKAEGTITQLTQTTTDIRNDINNNYYTITQTNELVQNASTGITNTFSEAGGNNVFRNTGLWFGPDTTTEEKEAISTDGKIEIDDGADNTLGNLKLYGNTEQETSTGKNLLNDSIWSANSTVNSSTGEITYSQNNVASEVYIPVLPNTTYTFSSAFNLKAFRVGKYKSDKTFIARINSSSAVNSWSFTTDENTYFVRWNVNYNDATITREILDSLKLQLEKNNSSTSYEPYTNGPSPNPDYPQTINTVTGRQEISVSGKNLFDASEFENNIVTGKIINDSGSEVSDPTSEYSKYKVYIKANTTYYFNGYFQRVYLYDKNGNFVSRPLSVFLPTTRMQLSYTPSIDGYILFQIRTEVYNENKGTEMLSIGSTPTTYEAFKGGNYEINLGKNLFDKDNANVLNAYINGSGVITSDSSDRTIYIPCNSNTTYTIQKMLSGTANKNRFRIGCTSQTPTMGITLSKYYVISNTDAQTIKTYTFTTDNTAKYLVVTPYTSDTSTTWEAMMESIQIEKGSQATTYSAYKTPIELCKINNYRDYIYKSNGTWYKHKAIGKFILNGTEDWNNDGGTIGTDYRHNIQVSKLNIGTPINTNYLYKSNYFYAINIGRNNVELGGFYLSSSWLVFDDKNATISSTNNWKSWLLTHNTEVYYVLATPVEEEITNTELVSQLNAIKTVDGYNLIILASQNIDTEFDISYLIDFSTYEYWTGDLGKMKEEKASNLNALLLQHSNVYQEQQVPNGNYTISFKYKKLINLANVKCIINDVEYELNETTDTEFVQQLEVSTQHIKVEFTSDKQNSCEIYDLMVNAGTVKLAYSQNQNETTTDTVNISKGITITSTDTDTTFKANADGIRTLDRNGNVLTKFTDTGMTTKEMIVEETSQIVGVLVQEVGEQTWFTRL